MMILAYLIRFFLTIIFIESLVQLVIKSTLFERIRKWMGEKSWFTYELFHCGYCFSFWVSILTVASGVFRFGLISNGAVDFVFSVLVLQRLSNIFHNCIDKFTDKYYDLRYINSDKEND